MIQSKSQDNTVIKETPYQIIDVFQLFDVAKIPYPTKISLIPLIQFWEDQLNSEDPTSYLLAKEIKKKLEKTPEFLKGPIKDPNILQSEKELVLLLCSELMPPKKAEKLFRISGPFNTNPFFDSVDLVGLLKNESMSFKLDKNPKDIHHFVMLRAGCRILNQFYGQNLKLAPPYILSVTDNNSLLERHYQANIDDRFVEVKKLKPLKKLSKDQIHQLITNFGNVDLWLKYLPPSNFEFHGVIGTLLRNVTSTEILSKLKNSLLDKDALVSNDKIKIIESDLRSFFKLKDLCMGIFTVDFPSRNKSLNKYGINHGFLSNNHKNLLASKFQGSIYDKCCSEGKMYVVEDLCNYPNFGPIEKELSEKGINSILVTPLYNENQKVIGILELGAHQSYALNSFSTLRLKEVLPLFNVAVERSREEIKNQIEAIIRERFTSIHPSIEWRFVKEAFKILHQKGEGIESDKVDNIVFHDNYPLYGQADIVGSTAHRNLAIQEDLVDNLYQIKKVLKIARENYFIPLIGQMMMETDQYIQIIKRGISSNTEFQILEFITKEIHPLFRQLRKKSKVVNEAQSSYFQYLDPKLGFVYRKRKEYEKTVATINRVLSELLDEEQLMAQQMIPHYFEKYQTDGIAYNIYVGQSLLRKGKFHSIHLRNLLLWQLINMCTITRKIASMQADLPIPLTTAQLILVHSTPLSIRFRTDEKRFDVDGAYNARYEIVKKRIDKALIEGTKQRLTVSGKIAIVYQHEEDRIEYGRFLKYLIKQKIISKEVEDLKIGRLQGVQGLKALRIKVL